MRKLLFPALVSMGLLNLGCGKQLHAKYAELKKLGVVEEICDFCAGAFKVKDGLKQMSDATLVGEFEGHPSLKKWVDQGYQVIVL